MRTFGPGFHSGRAICTMRSCGLGRLEACRRPILRRPNPRVNRPDTAGGILTAYQNKPERKLVPGAQGYARLWCYLVFISSFDAAETSSICSEQKRTGAVMHSGKSFSAVFSGPICLLPLMAAVPAATSITPIPIPVSPPAISALPAFHWVSSACHKIHRIVFRSFLR